MAEYFRLLDNLGQLETEELLGWFTTENIDALRALAKELKEGMDLERVLSEKRFVHIVRELYHTRKIWSERLDETIASAAHEYGEGNRIQALWILNGFIRFCPSPYYRELAESVLEEYEKE